VAEGAGSLEELGIRKERRQDMKREKEACHCKNITYGMIEDAVKSGASTYEEVQKLTGFGSGCGQVQRFYPLSGSRYSGGKSVKNKKCKKSTDHLSI